MDERCRTGPVRVVVIGAGVAGLSAAASLKDGNFWKSKGHQDIDVEDAWPVG